jgi:hypothetical protein
MHENGHTNTRRYNAYASAKPHAREKFQAQKSLPEFERMITISSWEANKPHFPIAYLDQFGSNTQATSAAAGTPQVEQGYEIALKLRQRITAADYSSYY